MGPSRAPALDPPGAWGQAFCPLWGTAARRAQECRSLRPRPAAAAPILRLFSCGGDTRGPDPHGSAPWGSQAH